MKLKWYVVSKLVWSKYVYNSKSRFCLYQSTVTPKRTEQNLFVHIGKSESEETSNKRLCAPVSIEATDRHSRATSL